MVNINLIVLKIIVSTFYVQSSHLYTIKVKRHGTFNNANLIFENLVFDKYLVSIVYISLPNKYIVRN